MSALREAAQQFVADYENGDLGDMKHYARALRAALAQQEQEQEPVATVRVMGSFNGVPALGCLIDAPATHVKRGDKLYTRPPRREWQSLTEEEVMQMTRAECVDMRWPSTALNIARDVEAALKERNT